MTTFAIDTKLAQQAESVLADFGMTPIDAINLLFNITVKEKSMPLIEDRQYNKETLDSLAEVDQILDDLKSGKEKGYTSTSEMFAAIGINIGE